MHDLQYEIYSKANYKARLGHFMNFIAFTSVVVVRCPRVCRTAMEDGEERRGDLEAATRLPRYIHVTILAAKRAKVP